MPDVPQISDAEWEIMKAVWDHGPLTAGQLVEWVETRTAWRPGTVKTLLSRLVRKGAVTAEPLEGAGRAYLYSAAISRQAAARAESRFFLSRVFDGAAAPALLHLLKSADLSRSEIDQLKRILSESVAKEEKP